MKSLSNLNDYDQDIDFEQFFSLENNDQVILIYSIICDCLFNYTHNFSTYR